MTAYVLDTFLVDLMMHFLFSSRLNFWKGTMREIKARYMQEWHK